MEDHLPAESDVTPDEIIDRRENTSPGSTGDQTASSAAPVPRRAIRQALRGRRDGPVWRRFRAALPVGSAVVGALVVGSVILHPLLTDAGLTGPYQTDNSTDEQHSTASATGTAGAGEHGDAVGADADDANSSEDTSADAAPSDDTDRTGSSHSDEETITVHVAGRVKEPGVVELPSGSRLESAVSGAGGLADDANEASVNLARLVTDGEQIIVAAAPPPPSSGGAPPSSANAPNAAVPDTGPPTSPSEHSVSDAGQQAGQSSPTSVVGPVNINTADSSTLQSLPGVGPATAQQIVTHRESNGPFAHIEQLLDVSGIGEAKFAQLESLVSI